MKIILLDISVFINRSVFDYSRQLILRNEGKISTEQWIPFPTYSYFKMILSVLKRIGCDKETKIIAIEDARNSWRKAFLEKYKEGRTEVKKAMTEIDWLKEYENFNKFNYQLNKVTDWHFIKISNFISGKELKNLNKQFDLSVIDDTKKFGIEADDIIAVLSKIYSKEEVFIVSIDSDLDQLAYYGAKIFNPMYKFSNKRGFLKIIDNPLAVLAKKIRLGDKSDKIGGEISSELKKMLIDLINLPSFVEEPITNILNKEFVDKQIDYSNLPFKNSLGTKDNYDKIYCANTTLLEESINRHNKLAKRKQKKTKLAYEKKKAEKIEAKKEDFR